MLRRSPLAAAFAFAALFAAPALATRPRFYPSPGSNSTHKRSRNGSRIDYAVAKRARNRIRNRIAARSRAANR